MNTINIKLLKALRKAYSYCSTTNAQTTDCLTDADVAGKLVYNGLTSNDPFMVARLGSTELLNIKNYLGVKMLRKNPICYIKGECPPWWWESNTVEQLCNWSGFFPGTIEKVEQFCELVLEDCKEVDILGSWQADEVMLEKYMQPSKVHLRLLEPFWTSEPWTKALENKKILVLHPFAETILKQYDKRHLLFDNSNILPNFASLHVIKAVQSLGKADSRFNDWFEALEYMKNEINAHDYDVCLIGAGAYGFSLAAHVKRKGRKAVHLGGALQLLFGIKGKRWEDPEYGVKEWGISRGFYSKMMNDFWVRPAENERPSTAQNVESACYW